MNEPNPALAHTEEFNRQLRVLAAPGMLDQDYVVAREPDETDVEYDASGSSVHSAARPSQARLSDNDHRYPPGVFVWCAFPESEDPVKPGPLHVSYGVSGATAPHGWAAYASMVAYTTSRTWFGPKPPGVRVFERAEVKSMGQDRAFTLDLRRIALLPVTEDWFPFLGRADKGYSGVQRRTAARAGVPNDAYPQAAVRNKEPTWPALARLVKKLGR